MKASTKSACSFLRFFRLERKAGRLSERVSQMEENLSRLDDELAKLAKNSSETQTNAGAVQKHVVAIQHELQNVSTALGTITDSLKSSSVALQQQMNEAIGQISKGKYSRCRFQIETRNGSSVVTQYEFIAKEHWFVRGCKAIWGVLPVALITSLAILCWMVLRKASEN